MIRVSETDLVIFDCDGVLVDSEPLANDVLAACATRLGLPMDGTEAMATFKGMTMTQVHARLEAELGRRFAPDWLEGYDEDCHTVFRDRLQPVPGALDLVARVEAAGLKSRVASQGKMEKMRITLGKVGLWEHFAGRIHSATEVERPKPFPDLFLHAAREAGVTPERCVVIEDSFTGVKAGLAAGMRVICLASPNDRVGAAEFGADDVSLLNEIRIG